MRNRGKLKGRSEGGQFAGIPKVCMKHLNYIELSMPAKVLLWEFCHQYTGYNNGDLCATYSELKKRGWRSKGTLARAIAELKDRRWIIIARQGGRNQCSLYALTFKAIDECKGKLDILSTNVASGDWKKINSSTPYTTQCTPYEGQ